MDVDWTVVLGIITNVITSICGIIVIAEWLKKK